MIARKDSPEIEWLSAKWGLPEAAFPAVRELMRQEAEGSTASPCPADVSDWGRAAAGEDQPQETPIVLVREGGRMFLQSRHLFETERGVAARMLALAEGSSPVPDLSRQLKALFPESVKSDRQLAAARVAATKNLAIITGGPGTGKTYTLARILGLLAEAGMPADSIRLAAPTGKAADRMKRAVIESLVGLPAGFQDAAAPLTRIAESCSTIHSLLGYHPDSGRCRFHPDAPLACQVLILDECSMIDVHLWRAILRALHPECRLILLGDPNQLESVGQGNIFSELARAAAAPGSPLHAAHVHLTEARRFRDRPDIFALARAIEDSDADAVSTILQRSRNPESPGGLAWLEPGAQGLACKDFPPRVLAALEAVATADSPRSALDALARVCVLTAQREYFVGALAMSRAIEQFLSIGRTDGNHPIIINRNDPETGLRNGTVGVLHSGSGGIRKAYFPASDGAFRALAVTKLPDFSPAWAITIHRSQGSEYEDVLVILPRGGSPMNTRELLYTAITRAKNHVTVVGDLESIQQAVATSGTRCSLLGHFLSQ